jgi:hypothetical protein
VEAEISMGLNEEGISGHVEDEDIKKVRAEVEQQQKQEAKKQPKKGPPTPFEKRLEDAYKMKQKLRSKVHVKCHNCCEYMEKVFFHSCKTCKTAVCLPCIAEISKVTNRRRQAFDQCVVCLRLCKCVECRSNGGEQLLELFD